jgi:hypothetical protein
LVAGSVAMARIVGPGFTWLTGGTAAALGLAGWALPASLLSRMAVVLALIALVWARNNFLAGCLLLVAAFGYLFDAASLGGWLLAVTGSAALGGVTGEMMLGHWYLVDPRLPRSALRALAVVGIAGLAADGLAVWAIGDMGRSGASIAFGALLVLSVILMVAVIGALRHPAYSGVMAATGLSYLAVLTSLGAIFLGRAMLAGAGPFTA